MPPDSSLILVALVILVWSLVTPDRVKASLEAQATRVLGTPVMVRTLEVAWYPRVGLRLEDVRIGQPQQLARASFGSPPACGGCSGGGSTTQKSSYAEAR